MRATRAFELVVGRDNVIGRAILLDLRKLADDFAELVDIEDPEEVPFSETTVQSVPAEEWLTAKALRELAEDFPQDAAVARLRKFMRRGYSGRLTKAAKADA